MIRTENAGIKWLIGYYGLLQCLHLGVLARAGWILLQGLGVPFPILPPPGGWEPQAMSFFFGLGATDTIGILLGILFAYRAVILKDFNRRSGLLSLTIFITGALVFGAGTIPSGAWAVHPVAYGVMVVLFLPTGLLFIKLLTDSIETQA